MITEKILVLEYSIVNDTPADITKREAIRQLKSALNQIDFKSEIIPLTDYERLVKLFESLLNRPINQTEIAIIKHLIEP